MGAHQTDRGAYHLRNVYTSNDPTFITMSPPCAHGLVWHRASCMQRRASKHDWRVLVGCGAARGSWDCRLLVPHGCVGIRSDAVPCHRATPSAPWETPQPGRCRASSGISGPPKHVAQHHLNVLLCQFCGTEYTKQLTCQVWLMAGPHGGTLHLIISAASQHPMKALVGFSSSGTRWRTGLGWLASASLPDHGACNEDLREQRSRNRAPQSPVTGLRNLEKNLVGGMQCRHAIDL